MAKPAEAASIDRDTPPSPIERESWLWFALAVQLALWVSALNLIRWNGHPLFSGDTLLALAALALTGMVIASLYMWRARLWRTFLLALASLLLLDLVANDIRVASIITVPVAMFAVVKRRTPLQLACVFLGAMLLSSLIGLGGSAPYVQTTKKSVQSGERAQIAIVHLILDEHIGIEGLVDPDGSDLQARQALRQDYSDMGFAVFDRAYSEHFHTVNALPWVMNFGKDAQNPSGKGGVRIEQNRYFQSLRDRGYRIHVSQTSFANFCASGLHETCTTYNQQSLGVLAEVGMPTVDRAKLIYFKVLDQSVVLRSASHWIDRGYSRWTGKNWQVDQPTLKRKSRSNTLAGLDTFDDLIARLAHARAGDAFVAHILFPHTPYITDADCVIKPYAEWEDRDTSSVLAVRQRNYRDQLLCSTKKVQQAVAALDRSRVRGNYTLIVQGDHGSRLTKFDPDMKHRGRYDHQDVVAGFSTLFAVKLPGNPPKGSGLPVTTAHLLEGLVANDFVALPETSNDIRPLMVNLDDGAWRPTGKQELPARW